MIINMKESSRMAKRMAKVCISGQMGKFMMVSGGTELRKVMVFGRESSVILISESGKIAKLMVTEYINGKMETGMKETGEIVLSMDRELIYLQMAIPIQANTNLVSLMVMDNTSGRTAVFMSVNSKMVSSMERVNGKSSKIPNNATNTMESMLMIKRTVTECSLGRVAMFIEETMLMMSETAMEKCSGLMVQCIKANGKKVFSMAMVR
jgi:hypothetical protein